ncbi:hydroxyethylthiazole kinase [Nocardioides aequoreus]|uniref:hydroxyethylthiazole kinase n=1 Tax=Nocardioides aequoreus TaxID=397278 RepID=UPI0009FD1A97|nr:hydroxyethylthiazole kinase [Nocardioides aequoreus]
MSASSTLSTLLDDLRAQQPLVQCLTNSVVTNVTANALLATGAAPAMVDLPEEAEAFAGVADAVLVNLGTPHREQREAMVEAAAAARAAGTPWVLDPVAIGTLAVRTALAHTLLEHRPSVVRGNASEVLALARGGSGGRGVDATLGADEVVGVAAELAARLGCVVAVSGETDVVTDGRRTGRVAGGSALLTRVTGGGCALGAVVAALCAVAEPYDAAVAAHELWARASERAAATAAGPGSFTVAFLDELAAA